ncbi:MAG: hypothetical protein KatS3mg131_2517 [Candidatus Tectimicrobiota bacterium]|nr:MAG: hypothetical protein KatS3mg131_2517 [Candidatus Tectomicrobia bacterium]
MRSPVGNRRTVVCKRRHDHAQIVNSLRQRSKQVIDKSLHPLDLQRLAAASLVSFERRCALARALRQAQVAAQRRKTQAAEPCCPGAKVAFVHPRT